ncbi:tripartite tricarboxylate transporter TctB family protein [Nesterenkonia sandarakina]|uniref:DUF1468 domain-containing protein n=1 Tax=Nesterenkonia sandarakina TaxID=272918 RepID=A0A7Z0EA54_9MICC|nr:tripartite tricarboxylate transporter TctB family protein [Nesterenkonia sandarakina]NYJ17219.1 hypothetical protein [Nesterenkonia sandarakina]
MADRLFCLALVVLAGAFWSQTAELPGPTGGAALGPAFFPRVILSLIFGLTAILLVRSFVAAEQAVSFQGLGTFLRVHWRVPAMVAMLSAYVALLGLAGFVLSSAIFLLGGFALLIREYSKPVLIASLALAMLLPFTLNRVFENVLRIVLP